MNLLFDNFVLLEQEEDNVPQEQTNTDEFQEEFLPLKKYHLTQRLFSLQNHLSKRNIQNEDLNTLLKFNKELSYDSIIHLIKGILPFLQQQLKEATVNEKKQ